MQPTHAAPQAPYQYPQTQTKPDNGKIVAAYICAVISILLLPIILGPVAIYLAHSAEGDGHPGGKTAKGVAIVCMILGFALGALVYLGSQ